MNQIKAITKTQYNMRNTVHSANADKKWTLSALAIGCTLLIGGLILPNVALSQKKGDAITLDFVNADIEAIARTMGVLTGRNIVVDPRVKGNLNLSSEKPVSPSAAYAQFITALRLQNAVVVQSQGIYKIIPEADAKTQAGEVEVVGTKHGQNQNTKNTYGNSVKNDQIITQIFNLKHDSAANLIPILRPLINPNNTINVNVSTNSLVITDYADNLKKLAQIITASDIATSTDVEIIPLQHAIAGDIAPLVLRLIDSSGAPESGGSGINALKLTVLAEPRSNALIIKASNGARLNLVKSLIAKLDQPSSKNVLGNVHVVFLKNGDATKLAAMLRAAMSGTATTSTPSASSAAGGIAGGGAAAASTTGGQVQADTATNSLIITASEPQYRQIRAIIDQLDGRRAQVFVESLIAEVNSEKAAEFGVQWQKALGNALSTTNSDVIGTNFKTQGGNLLTLNPVGSTNAAITLPGKGLNLALGTLIAGKTILGAFANFIQTSGEGNILSTPNLLTLDNEEAKIIIGQNVPFVTGQYTNGSSSGGAGAAANPFQTIERKDVGLTLKVKPQISENGTIKLEIFQEVSNVQTSSLNAASGLITNKRSIQTNVLVEDGGVVILGGLLEDQYGNSQEKVPLLGDIPLLGNLFKTEARTRKKTNLMVFLRPVIVRDANATEDLSLSRYDLMRTLQLEKRPDFHLMLPIQNAPLLPTAPLPFSLRASSSLSVLPTPLDMATVATAQPTAI